MKNYHPGDKSHYTPSERAAFKAWRRQAIQRRHQALMSLDSEEGGDADLDVLPSDPDPIVGASQ